MSEVDRESAEEDLRALPGPLPPNEQLLWQGSPAPVQLAIRAFHIRKIGIYFLLLMIWDAAWTRSAGESWRASLEAAGALVPLAVAALALIGLLAWGTARTTVYSITTRRVMMRYGMGVRLTVNLPFRFIKAVGLAERADGTGDIPVALSAGGAPAWIFQWPHVRPWRLLNAEPMLRCVPDAKSVAGLLGEAIAAASEDRAVAARALTGRDVPDPQSLPGGIAGAAAS